MISRRDPLARSVATAAVSDEALDPFERLVGAILVVAPKGVA